MMQMERKVVPADLCHQRRQGQIRAFRASNSSQMQGIDLQIECACALLQNIIAALSPHLKYRIVLHATRKR